MSRVFIVVCKRENKIAFRFVVGFELHFSTWRVSCLLDVMKYLFDVLQVIMSWQVLC